MSAQGESTTPRAGATTSERLAASTLTLATPRTACSDLAALSAAAGCRSATAKV
jgi:hypothetical protein